MSYERDDEQQRLLTNLQTRTVAGEIDRGLRLARAIGIGSAFAVDTGRSDDGDPR
jgi:hypothetical protein